jgi:hypothetical protein
VHPVDPSAGTDVVDKVNVDVCARHTGYNVIDAFAVYVPPTAYACEPPSEVAQPTCV